MRPRVVVALAGFAEVPRFLGRALPEAEVVPVPPADVRQALPGAVALIPTMARVDETLLAAGLPHLRLVQQWGAGLEGVDIPTATRLGVAVANVPTAGTGNAISVAEWCVLAALALSRHFPAVQRQVWEGQPWGVPSGQALAGRTAGLVGLGGIGQALAERLRPFGMRLVGVKRQPDPALAAALGLDWLAGMDALPRLLDEADYVFLCLPLTAHTRDLIGATELARMRPGAFLVNPARGGLVSRAALAEALDGGRLGGAALDVFWQEPPEPGDPLLAHPRLLATPHIAGVTDASYGDIGARVARNVRRVLAGEAPESCVNPEVAAGWHA